VHVLQPLRELFKPEAFPDLLVGLDRADDAAVYRLNEKQAIVSTTDFFPPVVDDPYDFGAIAAANAMSDIYAMGGEVLFAINLVAFPANLDRDILRQVLRGGAEKVAEAGAVVVGGHSVDDKEPKYGLAVTGIIDPQLIKRKGAVRVGDSLVLTKSLGTGVITTALKQGIAGESEVAAAVASMKVLNREASRVALAVGATGMTDVTGFGLLGHAQEMASQSGVGLRFVSSHLPWLPGAADYGRAGAFPGGMGRNLDFFAPHVTFGDGLDLLFQDLLWTPETSGGLLVALPVETVPSYLKQVPQAVLVGRAVEGDGQIVVEA
jgi:selenide,water dikinase